MAASAGLVAALLLGVMGGPETAQAVSAQSGTRAAEDSSASAAGTLSCDPGYVYQLSGDGSLRQIAPNGTITNLGAAPGPSVNGLGISPDGTSAFAYRRTSSSGNLSDIATILSYDPASNTWTDTGDTYPTGLGNAPIAGAVNPVNGKFLFGGFTAAPSFQFRIFQYNPGETPRFTYLGYLDTTVPGVENANGDMAFDADGNLTIIRGSYTSTSSFHRIYTVTASNLAAAGGGALIPSSRTEQITPPGAPAVSPANGIAFDGQGRVFVGMGSSVFRYDMPNWSNPVTLMGTVSLNADLASCPITPTITIQKRVPSRVNATDQFTLQLSQGGTLMAQSTTTGASTGIQAQQIGPLPVTRGATLAFTEIAAGSTALAGYSSQYSCTIDGQPLSPAVSGNGRSGSITIPATGGRIVCIFTNTPALLCDTGYIYTLGSYGGIIRINPNGSETTVLSNPNIPGMNGLGIAPGGTQAFAFQRSGANQDIATIHTFSPATNTWTNTGDTYPTGLGSSLTHGAVDPATGKFMFGGFGPETDAGPRRFVIYQYNPGETPRFTVKGYFDAPSINIYANGDFAFDSDGDLFVLYEGPTGAGSGVIYSIKAANLAAGTGGALPHSHTNSAAIQPGAYGLAFDDLGRAYIGGSDGTVRYDMPGWTNPVSFGAIHTDLASCSYPQTITIQKNVNNRVALGDQFALSLSQGSTTIGEATTTGASNGVQSEQLGPFPIRRGATLTFGETGAAGTSLTGYTTSYACTVDGQPMSPAVSGSGTSRTLTVPTTGTHIVCTLTNAASSPPSLNTVKTVKTVNGAAATAATTVKAGDVVVYDIVTTNTGGSFGTTTLSDTVPANTTYTGTGEGWSCAAGSIAGTACTQSVTVAAGASVTKTYTVTIIAPLPAGTKQIANLVASSDGTCTSCHPINPVQQPIVIQVQKVGENSAGTVAPMDGSSWAIYATATSPTPLIASVPAAADGGSPVTGLFRASTLDAGSYWLEETAALPGFSLLAERVPFTVAANGTVTLGSSVASNVTVVDIGGVDTIRVEDMPALELPEAGGMGTLPIHLSGALLLLAGLILAAPLIRRPRSHR